MSETVTYRIRVADQEFDVTLEGGPGGMTAKVGDDQGAVGWRCSGPHAGTLRLDASTVTALVAEAPGGWNVALGGYEAEVEVTDPRSLRLAATAPRRLAAAGRRDLRAPMPGRVVALRVAVGEAVERGAVVAVLEAMKMENELRATEAGRVVGLPVAEGEAVEQGALLAVLEPLVAAPAGESASDGPAANPG
jgi:glutaconyl-CoA/methylmalonyl-CoA decarboxylase subunit gamma